MSEQPAYVPSQAGTLALTFFVGASLGALVVALVTPKTGPELRGDLKALARRARGEAGAVAEEAGEAWDDLKSRAAASQS